MTTPDPACAPRSRTTSRRRALALAVLALLAASAVQAQQVGWREPVELAAGVRGALELEFVDAEPVGPVTLPAVTGLRVLGQADTIQNLTIVNGRRTASMTLAFPVVAAATGALEVPAFEVETSAGRLAVPALTVAVGAAAVRDANGDTHALAEAVEARLTPATMNPYAGEVFDVELVLSLKGGQRGQVVGTPAWSPGAAQADPWSDGHAVGGGSAVRFHTRAVAPQAGRVELAPADQEVQIAAGRAADPFGDLDAFARLRGLGGGGLFDSFFGRAAMTDVTVRSNAVQLDVRPLPQPAPDGFSGAVGQFTLESTLTPAQPKTGEPITWTLTLAGTGNWDGGVTLPARAVPADLRTLQPKQRSSFGDAGRFSGEVSEDLVLIPNQPGALALEPVRFVFFDPETGRYETAEARPPVLQVNGAPLAQPAAAAAADRTASAPAAAADPVAAPLPGSGSGHAPWPFEHVALLAATPIAAALGGWLLVAAWRAWARSSRRLGRRTARALRAAIRAARDAATPEARSAALLAWQQTAARLLGIDRAAPTAAQLRGIADAGWVAAWADSEHALYGREQSLPADWCDRALALCAPPRRAARPPRRRAARLVPQTAATALLLAGLAVGARAESAGDPLDWVARHNAGVAAAAAGDTGRALAESSAAFVLAPRQAAVRELLTALAAQQPDADSTVARLAGAARLAPLASPWHWQLALLAGALLCATAIAGAARRRAALLLAAAGLGCAGIAAMALSQYGGLADPRAAVLAAPVALRPLPTEAQPADGAPALPAGTVVRIAGEFLGWSRVRHAGGGEGWVRTGDVVPIYGAVAS